MKFYFFNFGNKIVEKQKIQSLFSSEKDHIS